ncbi:MAG: hypothetical protein HY650_06145 [Acidobacteria bacterium]|nr:hypothetical protein [Acidobacteriota bacterium]
MYNSEVGESTKIFRHCATAAYLLVSLWPQASCAHHRESSDFQLALTREYGRSTFSQCRLGVVAFEGRVTAQLNCTYAAFDGRGQSIPPLAAREELPAVDSKRLIDLVQRAALYHGEHIGTDGTPVDGVFETIKLTTTKRTVVLVTSGNPSFTRGSVRRELLSELTAMEERLRRKKTR